MYKCIDILRDEKGVILTYTLQDETGATQMFEKSMLKAMLRQRAISVSNLTLTTDNRLVLKRKN